MLLIICLNIFKKVPKASLFNCVNLQQVVEVSHQLHLKWNIRTKPYGRSPLISLFSIPSICYPNYLTRFGFRFYNNVWNPIKFWRFSKHRHIPNEFKVRVRIIPSQIVQQTYYFTYSYLRTTRSSFCCQLNLIIDDKRLTTRFLRRYRCTQQQI